MDPTIKRTTDDAENPFVGWTTIEDAAILLGLQNTTVRRWANAGGVRNFQIGRRTRVVNVEEVRAYARGRVPMPDDEESMTYISRHTKRQRRGIHTL